MCKWNPNPKEPERSRWCTHGHTEHEELYDPNIWSRPPVIWCNACWTICAYESNKTVRKGALGAISDAFNGTTRAPPYIDKFKNGKNGNGEQYPGKGAKRHPSQPGPSSAPMPPMKERARGKSQAMGTPNAPSPVYTAMPPVQGRADGQRMPQTTSVYDDPPTYYPAAQPRARGVLDVQSTSFSAIPSGEERFSGQRTQRMTGMPSEIPEPTPVDEIPLPMHGPLQTHNLDMYAEFDEGTEGLK